MARPSKSEQTWSDSELKDAVAASANWRHVMRALGLNADSAGAIRIVRRHVERLGLDTSHFRGRRIWSDAQLRRAVIDSRSWDELLTTLGPTSRSEDGRIRVKAHAIRLGLDLSHLENPIGNSPEPGEVKPDLRYLRDAATSLAASWFALCGLSVALPAEPTVYDLLVVMQDGIKRVQVKTTTCYSKDGWTVVVGRRPYSIGKPPGSWCRGQPSPETGASRFRAVIRGRKPTPRDAVRRVPGVDCPVCQLKENTSRARRRGYAIRSSCTRVRAEPRAPRCATPACRW